MLPNKIYHGDALEVLGQWADACIDTVVTSPPYWGGLRDYGVDGQLGLEKTPEEYIEKMVEVFREIRRVLRPWGTVWLNEGDCHANEQRRTTKAQSLDGNEAKYGRTITGERVRTKEHPTIKDQELCGIPGRLVLALQADGWWRKSDIIWQKLAPMPESVSGWRWEQHCVKIGNKGRGREKQRKGAAPERPQQDHDGRDFASDAEWKDCPGCPKCKKHNGLILQKGSGRPNVSYDYIFLLAKSREYFYDTEAAKASQSLRNVWTMPTGRYPDAHYATFPEELPRRCILSGTSAKGNCAKCRMPRVRILEGKGKSAFNVRIRDAKTGRSGKKTVQARATAKEVESYDEKGYGGEGKRTVGWLPSCECGAGTVRPIVLDPFFGSGTTGMVAAKLDRDWVGIELNESYIKDQARVRTGLATSEEIVAERPLFAEPER